MDLSGIAQNYLKDNSATLTKLLTKFDPIFKKIDTIKKSMVKLDQANVSGIKDILTQLTGYYMEVVDIHKKVESLVKNKRCAYYYTRKVEIEAAGDKFSSAPTERESDLYVADERRVRDILAGKVDACIEGIRTCRTLLPKTEVKEVE
jgi:uncharacterized protein YdcH (DUF465 family)